MNIENAKKISLVELMGLWENKDTTKKWNTEE